MKMSDTAVAWHMALMALCCVGFLATLCSYPLFRRQKHKGFSWIIWMIAVGITGASIMYLWLTGSASGGFLD
jgi:ABC-type branched-subunit amino acid transport system permease subunit